jgi:hypothetical protein
VSGICLIAGLLLAPLGDQLTLRWTHSVQKTLWEEDYRAAAGGLRLVEARVRGSGAGMEPPADAVLQDGAWHYAPALPLLPRVALRHSPHVAPYVVCARDRCRPLPDWLPGLADDTVVELAPCE